MRAGAEGSARVDHDRELAGVGLLPRRPDPEAAGARRAVERAPGVLPARFDRRDVDVGEGGADRRRLRSRRRRAPSVSVVARLRLLEAARRELERDARAPPPPARAARARRRGRTRPLIRARSCRTRARPSRATSKSPTPSTSKRNGSCGPSSCSAMLRDAARSTLALARSPRSSGAAPARERVPVRRELRETGAWSPAEQLDEAVVRLGREPDVRVEPPDARRARPGTRAKVEKCSASLRRSSVVDACDVAQRTGTGS